MKKIIFTIFFVCLFALAAPQKTHASEGTFELKNTVGDKARCFAASVLMPNSNYNILVSCRDILYPGGTEVFSYIAWTTKLGSADSVKLGALGVGKVEFQTKEAFSSIFVTKETNSNPRSPQGTTVMKGDLQKIQLLEDASKAAYTPSGTPAPSPKPASNKLNVLRFGGTIGIIALVGIMVGIFLLIRSR
jgi:hypothetical protein